MSAQNNSTGPSAQNTKTGAKAQSNKTGQNATGSPSTTEVKKCASHDGAL